MNKKYVLINSLPLLAKVKVSPRGRITWEVVTEPRWDEDKKVWRVTLRSVLTKKEHRLEFEPRQQFELIEQ